MKNINKGYDFKVKSSFLNDLPFENIIESRQIIEDNYIQKVYKVLKI